MEGLRLVKKKDGWYNLYQNELGIGSTYVDLQGFKLSIKNCEAIERNYDLDALVDEVYPVPQHSIAPIITMNLATRRAFKAGFQKAVELVDVKKFSRGDMAYIMSMMQIYHGLSFAEAIAKFESLQSKEWDVEIVIEPVDLAFHESGNRYPLDASLPDRFKYKPKLDEQGCIILKRK